MASFDDFSPFIPSEEALGKSNLADKATALIAASPTLFQ